MIALDRYTNEELRQAGKSARRKAERIAYVPARGSREEVERLLDLRSRTWLVRLSRMASRA